MRRAAILLALPVLAGCGTASPGTAGSSRPPTTATQPAASAAVGTSAVATTAPWKPDGFPDEAFRVASPLLLAPSGPGWLEQRPCTPTDVVAKAATRPAADGVVGVIDLQGKTCGLHITQGPAALLDQAGHQLDVTFDATPPKVNPPENARTGLPLANGHALWGFAWRGSWCGARPAYVVVPMNDDPLDPAGKASYGDLKVPLTGAVPACHGQSAAVLQPGLAGYPPGDQAPSQAVLPPPPNWAALELALHVDSTVRKATITGISLTIRNTTGSAIALSPCPTYFLLVSNATANGGSEDASSPGGDIACGDKVLTAGASATYPIKDQQLDEGTPGGVAPGTQVTLELAIAGVPTTKTTTRVG